MKGTFYVVGGGEMGLRETYEIDKHLVSMVHKKSPKVLFIPTASHDAGDYVRAFKEVYSEFGCEVKALFLYDDPTAKEVAALINWADIIYVGGGVTSELLLMWKAFNLVPLLKKALAKGTIMAGLSAGLNCWFKRAYVDNIDKNPRYGMFYFLNGLNFLPFASSPHYNKPERKSFDDALAGEKLKGYAVEDQVALIFEDGKLVGNWKSYGCTDHHAYLLSYDSKGKLTKTEVA
jgi:dipeptidase E